MYLVYTWHILPGIYLKVDFGIYQVYTRYDIQGIETQWYIPGIYTTLFCHAPRREPNSSPRHEGAGPPYYY